MHWQSPLPPKYQSMTDAQLVEAIAARKAHLGREVVILGHHYQQDEVIRFADFTGDSFKLSQLAAERVKQVGARYIVFAGVHFMAETADVLSAPQVTVILPDLGAGCSMADMADHEQVIEAWEAIEQSLCGGIGSSRAGSYRVIPICYMNSTAAVKAFCGDRGGTVCTSSNAGAIFDWALRGGTQPLQPGEQIKILFIPDQHLGRNTAAQAGFDVATRTAVWDPRHPDGLGGLDEQTLERVTFLLWKGHCSVHKLFRPEHVDRIRALWPDVRVIVHPECEYAVCQKADATGSTERIIAALDQAAPGSRWAIGTEVHLVNRLCRAAAQRGVTARILSDCQCLCTTMYRIDLPHLLWVLDNLAEGEVVNRIQVPAGVRQAATVALDRMLQITAQAQRSEHRAAPATTR